MPPANALLGGAAGGGEGGGGTGEDSFVAAVLRVANTVYEIRSGHVASHSSDGDDESDSEGLHESKQRSKSIGLLVWTLLQVSVAVLRDVFVLLLLLLVGVVVLTYRYGDRQHWAWFHEHPVTWAAVALFGVEAAFRLYTKVKILHVQKTGKAPMMSPQERMVLFQRCLSSIDDNEYEVYFSQWFRNAPFHEIRRANVEQWFAWAFFDERYRCLTDSERLELDGFVKVIEAKLPRPFPKGFNRNVKAMRLMLDPVVVQHRPLLFYVVVAGLRFAHNVAMVIQGFRRHTCGPMVYWYRPAKPSSLKRDPIVFAHGLGIGLSQYCLLIHKLSSFDNAIFLVEINNVACYLVEKALAMEEALPVMESMLNKHGYQKAIWMGHSYGSVYVSWVLRSRPDLAVKVVLLDPVVILLNFPDVCYNFFYREPSSTIELGLHYFAARELFISKSMSRNFHWLQCILWSENINVPCLIVLSEKDAITNPSAIRHYIEKCNNPNINTLWLQDRGHADFLFMPQLITRIFEHVKVLLLTEANNTNLN